MASVLTNEPPLHGGPKKCLIVVWHHQTQRRNKILRSDIFHSVFKTKNVITGTQRDRISMCTCVHFQRQCDISVFTLLTNHLCDVWIHSDGPIPVRTESSQDRDQLFYENSCIKKKNKPYSKLLYKYLKPFLCLWVEDPRWSLDDNYNIQKNTVSFFCCFIIWFAQVCLLKIR